MHPERIQKKENKLKTARNTRKNLKAGSSNKFVPDLRNLVHLRNKDRFSYFLPGCRFVRRENVFAPRREAEAKVGARYPLDRDNDL